MLQEHSKVSRRKEIIKIEIGINELENKIKIKKTKSWFL